jgi:hypothetical protein
MPLNYKEHGTKPQPQSRGPVLHQPGDSDKKSSKLMIILLIVVVIAAVVFFVFKYDLLKQNKSAQMMPATQPEKSVEAVPDTASHAVQAPPTDTSMKPPVDSAKGGGAVDSASHSAAGLKRPPAELGTGNYTIYISRHKTKEVADSEAGTWRDAGYETNVSEADGWYRLAIGRYKTWDEAKATAEKLRDGLEAGYKIGKIDE